MNESLYKHEPFQRKNSIEEVINATKGPLIEIGGPTSDQWSSGKPFNLIDLDEIKKDIITTNIATGVEVWDFPEDSDEEELVDFLTADIQADATKLPFKDASIGAIFASALPIDIRSQIFKEAKRTLEVGGIFIWQHGDEKERAEVERLGFTTMADEVNSVGNHDYVFRKL